MKTHKDLFGDVCSLENLTTAYLKARKGKRYGIDVLKFTYDLEGNLFKLNEELETQSYMPGRYREFYVNDPKRRLIKAAPFRDRVVHHALCNVIDPIFDKTFIYDSYACRKGKGTHAGVDRLTEFLRSSCGSGGRVKPKIYALKCDVTKYFPSIDHEILLRMIDKKIRDEKTMWLITLIMGSSADKTKPRKAGIPIGNLTSQLSANIYLNELDYFVKHDLGVRYYLRYVDDFIILNKSKRRLHEIKQEITGFLKSMRLELHPKKVRIFPAELGVDFLGYVVYPTHRRLRKANVRKFSKKLKKLKASYKKGLTDEVFTSVNSWIAHARHADSCGLRRTILKENPFILDVYDVVKYSDVA